MAKLHVKAHVALRARLLVLHDVVSELYAAFGAVDRSGVLKRGIVDSQVIQSIRLRYLNREGAQVARITIDIDWEKHHVLAATGEGRMLEISQDAGASVAEQIHKTLLVIVKHTQMLRERYGVTRVVPSYIYLPEIQADPALREQARQQLGTAGRRFEWADPADVDDADVSADPEMITFIEFSPSKLKELRIKVEQRPPGE